MADRTPNRRTTRPNLTGCAVIVLALAVLALIFAVGVANVHGR